MYRLSTKLSAGRVDLVPLPLAEFYDDSSRFEYFSEPSDAAGAGSLIRQPRDWIVRYDVQKRDSALKQTGQLVGVFIGIVDSA